MELFDLPSELLIGIAENLDKDREIYAFARANRRLFDVAIAHLYRHNQRCSGNTALLWAADHGRRETLERAIAADLSPYGGRVLRAAVRYGSEDFVRRLIDWRDHDLGDFDDEDEESLLSSAAGLGWLPVARLLLQSGAPVNEPVRRGRFLRTPVCAACHAGHIEIVKLLLAHGADPMQRDGRQMTALEAACDKGHSGIVRLLLDQKVDYTALGNDGLAPAPMHYATGSGCTDLVELLLDRGWDPKAANRGGVTALMLAVSCGYLDIAKLLLERGADLSSWGTTSLTYLGTACSRGYVQIARLLLDHGVDPTARDSQGRPAMHYAAIDGFVNVVELLLDLGSDLEAVDELGYTALDMVAQSGHLDVAQLLLARGADFAGPRPDGWTPLRSALDEGNTEVAKELLKHRASIHVNDNGWPTLCLAAHRSSADICRLILDHSVDINEMNPNGWTPLLLAIEADRAGVVELLLQCGADTELATPDGWTALHLAAQYGHPELTEALLERRTASLRGPDGLGQIVGIATRRGDVDICKLLVAHGADVNRADNDEGGKPRETSLMIAVEEKNDEMVKLLLELSADVSVRTIYGCTALHMAAEYGDLDVLSVLMDYGADPMGADVAGSTPLHVAANYGRLEVLSFMFAHRSGVDVTREDNHGRTPLFYAAMAGRKDTIMMLLSQNAAWRYVEEEKEYRGAPDLSGNKEDFWGATPIFAATRNSQWGVVPMLLAADPSCISQLDGFGHSLIWWAKKSGHAAGVALLMEHARRHEVLPKDVLVAVEENRFDWNAEACWCDICTRCSIHSTESRSCQVCDGGNGSFLICGECRAMSAQCSGAAHPWKPYRCRGSTLPEYDGDEDG